MVLTHYSGGDSGIGAYVGVDRSRSEIVLAVRGSSNIENWITNANFDLVSIDLTDGAEVHDGFNDAWTEMSEAMTTAIQDALTSDSSFKVIASGHSLGGAVATLGAAYLRGAGIPVDLYTYGAPRLGNDVVSDFITDQEGAEWRVTHLDDPVPRLPPLFLGYRHISPEYWLSGSESTGDTYPVDEIQICEGNDNEDCNASTDGLNIDAHLTYFGDISACS